MADGVVGEKIHGGSNTLRETLTAWGADTVGVISDEPFNPLDPRRYPTFGVVAAETGVGPVENWLGIPRNSLKVNFAPDLAEAVLHEGARQGFDLTRVGEAGLEHGFVTVLNFLTPKWDLSYLWLI